MLKSDFIFCWGRGYMAGTPLLDSVRCVGVSNGRKYKCDTVKLCDILQLGESPQLGRTPESSGL